MLEKLQRLLKPKANPIQGPRYDTAEKEPVIRCSICTGEQVAGFRNLKTGQFVDVQLIRTAHDLDAFREQWGIAGEITRIY